MPKRTLMVEKDLIPVEKHVEGAPVVDLDKALPHTYYRRRNDNRYVFLTIMPDGLYVGWDTCGSCSRYVTLCQCSRGITPPKSVLYIFNQRTERIDSGILQRVTEIDKTTKKPSGVPARVESQGQVSAPSKRPKRVPKTTTAPEAPKKLRRIKKS
ncbi:hypothetical protein PBI_CANTARE_58 [Brevibacterium phage Cantare]|uniref:Uncharacterized protein n=1 Tax=Brevibacterium phage Cantare TaxID=2338395 RepID=A0A3G3LYS8_9CAUD|nr:hypothetical protein PQD70_gp058 [Brevibacterium phage Cantare]AYQ99278.1 hypothetical protein PBI_CANTARE_58 [Brevibacterium phage Cantare]